MATSFSASWPLNPIVVRESRARWRGSRAFLLAFFYAAILAAGMWWKYHDLSLHQNDNGDEFMRAAQQGHQLFWLISLLQAGIWLLVAPALTSASIAVERESGLMPAMILSKLTPGQIVIGKLVSALSFLLLLIVVALPVTAICFLMGGVSLQEFIGALALQIATALFGASSGLAASANQRDASSAQGATFANIGLWFVTSGVAFGLAANWPVLSGLTNVYGWTNPLWAVHFLIQPDSWMPDYPGQYVMPVWWQGWHYTVVALLAGSALQLWRTARILRAAPELQDDYETFQPISIYALEPVATPNFKAPYRGNERWRVPGASHILFGDAALRRELASCWKTRTPTIRALWILSVPVLACGILLIWSLWMLWQNPDIFKAADIFLSLTVLFCVVWILACSLMGAGTIARERESGTWNGLRLTLLSERSILTAKVVAPVVACVVYSLSLLPLVLLCWPENLGISEMSMSDAGFTQWLMSWALMLAVAIECSCLGAWWSQRAQSSSQASGAVMGVLGLLWIAIPILGNAMFNMSNAYFWHPMYGLFEILTRPAHGGEQNGYLTVYSLWPRFFAMMVFHLGVAALFFMLTLHRLRRSNRLERF